MALAKWDCIVPDASVIGVANYNNNMEYRIPGDGGQVVIHHNLDSTAPVVGNWLAFLPKQLLDYYITEMEIIMPRVDQNATPTFRFRVGMIDTDLGSLRSNDNNVWAGTQQVLTPTELVTSTVNGYTTGGVNEFSAGCDVGGGVVSIYKPDLLNWTAPNAAVGGFSNFNVGMQITGAPATWVPTDASKKVMRVILTLAHRARRVF